MILYTLIMASIAFFFYQEGKRAQKKKSTLLQNFCFDDESALRTGNLMHIIALGACVSACLMAGCFIYCQIATAPLPRIPAALSFLAYGIGFCVALWGIYKKQ